MTGPTFNQLGVVDTIDLESYSPKEEGEENVRDDEEEEGNEDDI